MTTLGKACLYALGIFVLIGLTAAPAQAKTNILLIVDGSNSMWGQIDNTAKVETARRTLSKLISDLPRDADLALMAYGHTREGDCKDVELLSAMGKDKPEMITTLIHTIRPTGKTPIANALAKAKDAFKGLEGQNNHVLLVSDGIESCDGDPCAVAKGLQEAGLNVSAHVIGFGVTKEEGKQLTCIAENTGGKYFDAADTKAFNTAIEEVTEIAQAEPAPPPAPAAEAKPVMWLEDDFNGDDLAEHWEILNPNPDNYIVENDELLVVSSKEESPIKGDVGNMFRLNKELPQGDWRAEIKFKVDFQTRADTIFFGLYEDQENFLLSQLWTIYNINSGKYEAQVSRTKVTKGEQTNSKTHVWSTEWVGEAGLNKGMEAAQPFVLRFEKKDRNYTAAIKLEGAEDPKWIDLPDLKLLRQKGNLVFGVYQGGQKTGETTLMVDWVKIEAMEASEAEPAAGE